MNKEFSQRRKGVEEGCVPNITRMGGRLLSRHSRRSILSYGSTASILSIGSAGSILSIGSAGSILSVCSVGSIVSIASVDRAIRNRRRNATLHGGARSSAA